MTATSATPTKSRTRRPRTLPPEVKTFKEAKKKRDTSGSLNKDEWLAGLRSVEVKDKRQKIRLRPWFAGAVYILLVVQNALVFMIVIRALQDGTLKDLQLIFSTLIGATLIQSYFILRLIAARVFGEITYNNNKG